MKMHSQNRADVIPIQVRDWKQLFDSRDPAPFFDRDLDDDAAEYIVDSLIDLGRQANRIEISFTAPQIGLEDTEALATAIRRHFEYQLRRQRIRHTQILKEGVAALVVGLTLLILMSLAIQGITFDGSETTERVLRESFVIFGWVVMWRPFDILVYSWWPFLSQRQILLKLTSMPIDFRSAPSG